MPVKKFLAAAQEIQDQAQRRKAREGESKGHDGGGHDESNWLVSYADMMTLLCGFFVLLFSMAKMDEPQYEKVQEAMAQTFGGDFKSPTKEMAKFVSQMLQEAGIEQQASIKVEGTGVTVAFESTLFFETLSADVRPEGRAVLQKMVAAMAERQKMEGKQYQIVIEGHTDSRPVLAGAFPSNWELSSSRAARVARYFLEQGFASDHLTAIGYADTRPTAPSRTPSGSYDEAALAKNRRVVLRILDPKADSIPLPPVAVGPAATEGAK